MYPKGSVPSRIQNFKDFCSSLSIKFKKISESEVKDFLEDLALLQNTSVSVIHYYYNRRNASESNREINNIILKDLGLFDFTKEDEQPKKLSKKEIQLQEKRREVINQVKEKSNQITQFVKTFWQRRKQVQKLNKKRTRDQEETTATTEHQEMPSMEDQEQRYEIIRILRMRKNKRRNQYEYEIQWQGNN